MRRAADKKLSSGAAIALARDGESAGLARFWVGCGAAGLALVGALAVRSVRADPAPAAADVVVTAQKSRETTLIDRKVYTVAKDVLSTSGTAADVFNNIPSVDVDADGVVSLRGDTNVTILVDGKPSAQFSGAAAGLSLQQFPAADIDRIEVMTNPPAQYKADGSAGVINIITKKSRKAGFSGGGQLNLGDKRRYVAGLNGDYNRGKLKLSAAINLRQDAKQRLVSDHRTATAPGADTPVVSQETIDEHFRRLIPQAKGEVDYAFNDRQSISLSLSHRELSGRRYFDQSDASQSPDGVPLSLARRHSDGYEWSADGAQALSFEQTLWRPDETLTVALRQSATHERERYAYADTDILPLAGLSHDHLHLSLDFVTTELSADYVLPMPGDRGLKLGYDYENDANAFDNRGDTVDPLSGALIDNSNITNHFRYRQQISALYGDYATPLGPWSLQSGVRVEQVDVATLQITGDVPGGDHYLRAYPSLNLDRLLSPSVKLALSLSRRVNRPDPQALNPFTDYQDIHNLRSGDAVLLPQDTWSYQAGVNVTGRALNYGLTGYYRFNRDSVTDVTRVVSADVLLITKANLPKSRDAGVEFDADGKLGRALSYSLSGDLFYDQIDATALGAAGLKSTLGLNTKASLDYRPTGADALQLSFSRTAQRLTPLGSVRAINLINFGYRRQVTPALSVVVTLSDALNGQRFERLVQTPGLNDVYVRHQLGQIGYAGLVYTFGSSAKAKKGGFDYDQ